MPNEVRVRTLRENALMHAMITHIASTQEWAGKKRTADVWKRLLVASWCRAHNEHVEMLPALDGNGFDIVYRKTSRLTVSECASLIEWIYAWGAEHDVRFPADRMNEKT
jgi:NinB protein